MGGDDCLELYNIHGKFGWLEWFTRMTDNWLNAIHLAGGIAVVYVDDRCFSYTL